MSQNMSEKFTMNIIHTFSSALLKKSEKEGCSELLDSSLYDDRTFTVRNNF